MNELYKTISTYSNGDEFVLRILDIMVDGNIHFYIRPHDKDGKTIDFVISPSGNLKQLQNIKDD